MALQIQFINNECTFGALEAGCVFMYSDILHIKISVFDVSGKEVDFNTLNLRSYQLMHLPIHAICYPKITILTVE